MSIECYHDSCSFHSVHFGSEGPFCDEEECRAAEQEILRFEEIRRKYLEHYTLKSERKVKPCTSDQTSRQRKP